MFLDKMEGLLSEIMGIETGYSLIDGTGDENVPLETTACTLSNFDVIKGNGPPGNARKVSV